MMAKVLQKTYLILIMLFLYAPIAILIVLSFNASRSRVVWGGFTLEWYTSLVNNSTIMNALWTTFGLALLSAFISSVIGLFGAIGIYSMKKRDYKIMLFWTNIPMINADIVTGIALLLWFVRFLPLGFSSVLLAHVTFNLPYVILCILPKLRDMDIYQYEAALDLGAGEAYAFMRILMPQILPGVLSGFLMAVTMSMDDFVITYFTKGAGVNTLSTLIYGEIRKGIKPEMYALSTVLFFIVLVLLILVNLPYDRLHLNLSSKKSDRETT
ncbi:spermidine/putrescine transport system permease protein [Lachnospiraceae bacterium XBB2008]|nr:spermidine/putrescine transport system permease protein [Lachnospiraceae bacterium XBB2008]